MNRHRHNKRAVVVSTRMMKMMFRIKRSLHEILFVYHYFHSSFVLFNMSLITICTSILILYTVKFYKLYHTYVHIHIM